MNEIQLKETITKIHTLWYKGSPLQDPTDLINLHKLLSDLFNYAEITETLSVNNPDKISPSDLGF